MEKPKVLISVSGGVAYLVASPEEIDVEIRDYDNDGDDAEEEFTDREIERSNSSFSGIKGLLKDLKRILQNAQDGEALRYSLSLAEGEIDEMLDTLNSKE